MKMNRGKPILIRSVAGAALAVTLTVPVLAACNKGGDANDNTQRVLRIATPYYGDDDTYFRQQFTQVFEYANPNITVEIVSIEDPMRYRYGMPAEEKQNEDPNKKLKDMLTGDNPPDVVMLNYGQLAELVNENLLLQLDPLIAKDKFDTSDIVPAVIDGIKAAGNGNLYAFSPTFSSQVLVYNKALFDAAGVPYPTDGMTWDEMFDLARRVSRGEGAERIYGFSFSQYNYGSKENLFHEMDAYISPLQLRMFDDKGERMTVDTDQWERVWTKMIQLTDEKIFPEPIDYSQMRGAMGEEFNPFAHQPFMAGKVAMTIAHMYNINELINVNKNAANIKGYTPIDWDIVTMPTHPEANGIGGNVYYNGMMAINAKAQNPDDAWRFLKFINGEEWAKLNSKSTGQLVSRAKYIQPRDGLSYNVKAFYALKPVPAENELSRLARQNRNIYEVYYMGLQYFKKALEKTVSVREALKEWQTAGDSMLQQMKNNPNGPIDMMPMPLPGGAVEVMPALPDGG
jgi:multiple sugar transport system substrate-binding protein